MSKRNGSMKHSPFDYLIQYGYSSMLPYSISRPQWVKTTHVDIIHLQTEADMKGQNRHILEFINNIQNIFMYHLNMNGSFQGLFCPGPLWTKQQDNLHQISQHFEAVRYMFRFAWSLWNLTDLSGTVLPRYLSNIRMIWLFWYWSHDFQTL